MLSCCRDAGAVVVPIASASIISRKERSQAMDCRHELQRHILVDAANRTLRLCEICRQLLLDSRITQQKVYFLPGDGRRVNVDMGELQHSILSPLIVKGEVSNAAV